MLMPRPVSTPNPLQVDPLSTAVLFKLLQNSIEVGHVYVYGPSVTNSTEHWYLSDRYTWPSAQSTNVPLQFVWVANALPTGQTPSTFKAYLEQVRGYTGVTHVKAICSDGESR